VEAAADQTAYVVFPPFSVSLNDDAELIVDVLVCPTKVCNCETPFSFIFLLNVSAFTDTPLLAVYHGKKSHDSVESRAK
jgi:hypothetical protein